MFDTTTQPSLAHGAYARLGDAPPAFRRVYRHYFRLVLERTDFGARRAHRFAVRRATHHCELLQRFGRRAYALYLDPRRP